MRKYLLALAILALASVGFAVAQDEDRSRFVRFVERQISTPDRQIRLGRIDGALSSDVRISSITIADREGVWLTIEGVRLVWSRRALLRGRLDVDLLEAESITISRKPLPPEGSAAPKDDAPFALPDLPVAILLDRLTVPEVTIAAGVIGPAATLSVDGSVTLDDGELDADLAIERLDRPGALTLATTFSSQTRQLAVDLSFEEPANGVLANALNIEGRPPLAFTVQGEGPLSDFVARIGLVADGEQLVSGTAQVERIDTGSRFLLDVAGNLAPLVPSLYQPLVDAGSRLIIDVTRRMDGTFSISRGELNSGVAKLGFTAELGTDLVPTQLALEGSLAREDGAPVALPGGGGRATVGSARINATLSGADETFSAEFALRELDTPLITAPAADLIVRGTAQNLSNPEARAVTFTVSGNAAEIASENPALADAIGSNLSLRASGDWVAGRAVQVESAMLSTDTVEASFAGAVGDALTGTYRLSAADLGAFAGLTGRPLGGAIELDARGSIGFSGLFDLTLDATARDLALGNPVADGLLAGTTTLSGRAARQEDAVAFENFRVANEALQVVVDGTVSDLEANLVATASLDDLAAVNPRAAGPLSARLTVTGRPAAPAVTARLTSPELVLQDQRLTDLEAGFDGTLARESDVAFDLDGRLSVNARLNGEPVQLSAALDSGAAGRTLDALSAGIAGATAEGRLTVRDGGGLDGRLALDVPRLEPLAALALTEASGSLSGTLVLESRGERQAASIDATARQIEVPGVSLGFAEIDLAIDDLFGVPAIDGRAEVLALSAGGFDVRSASLTASRGGEATELGLTADLGAGTLAAAGTLTRTPDGFSARLARFELAREGFAAILTDPTTVAVANGVITVGDTRLSIGDGSVVLGGRIGETLALEASVADLPLAIANLVRPDLQAGGTVSGEFSVTGTRAAPAARAEITARAVTAAPLRARGIAPLTLAAAGRYADGALVLDEFRTAVGAGTVTASGRVGETLDLDVVVDALPLALANAVRPELALSGTVSGRANVTGTAAAPAAQFEVSVEAASAAPLREAGIAPVNATVAGRYADGAAALDTARATIGGGTITATGSVGRRLDVTATLQDLPLAVVNAVRPGLDVSGTLSGRVSASGPLRSPDIRFDVSAPSVRAAPLARAGLPSASIQARGSATRGGVVLDDAVARIGGAEVRATGRVGPRLDLTVDAAGVPLALVNGVRPGLGLSGTLSGRAEVTGTPAAPAAAFDVSVAAFSAEPLRSSGVGPLQVRASGRFADGRVELASLTADGSGLSVDASGAVPLSGGGLDLRVRADAPLSLAERFVANRGMRISGDVTADVRLTGSLAAPQANGAVRISGLSLRDPQTGLVLSGGSLDARLAGERIVIESFRAASGEGSLAVSGSLSLAPGLPADLSIVLQDVRIADGRLYAVTLDGDLSVTGPLTGTPLVAGTIDVARAEITVPESFAGSARLLDLRHFDIPPDVLETLRRARAGPFDRQEGRGSQASGVRLDVTVDAPARIFVRGRGIDAELGGRIRLTGPVSALQPVGAFELIRGRIVILGQRIAFDEGRLTFFGDLNPSIRFVAETRTREVVVRVIVEGEARDPEIRFESDPDLPQDEVLAQLLFGRSLTDLSPFQLAQLAAAVAELAGSGGGPGLLEQFRIAAGLDNLEIITDPQGGTAAQAGRYIADNVYVGVRAGERSSGVTVNLDLTDELTLRGEALTDESSIGLYYEREY